MKSESSDTTGPSMNEPEKEEPIRIGEKLPLRFGNRKTRRKLEAEIRKIK